MRATHPPRSSESPDRFEVRLEGRVFPVALRGRVGFDEPPRPSGPEPAPAEPTRSSGRRRAKASRRSTPEGPAALPAVGDEVFARLWSALPLAGRRLADFPDAASVVDCFVASHERLEGAGRDASRLLEAVCRVHLRRRDDERVDPKRQAEAAEAKLRECLGASSPRVILGPELDAAVVSGATEDVYRALTESLRRSTRAFVASVFGALERLVDREVVGLIEWHGETVCKFHFFRRAILHEFLGQTARQRVDQYWRAGARGNVERTETTTTTTRTGRRVEEHVRYEQQLMRAESRALDSPGLVIPIEVRPVLDQVPAWLSPSVRVVLGDCFRERVIRRAERVEKWSEATTKVHVHERAARYFDPAVTLGTFVLAGWGPHEHQQELERRDRERAAHGARRRADDNFGRAGLLFAVACLVAMAGLVFAPALLVPGLLGVLAAFWPLNRALVHLGRAAGRPPSLDTLVQANAAALLLALAVFAGMLAVLDRSPLAGLGAAAFVALSVPLARSARAAVTGNPEA